MRKSLVFGLAILLMLLLVGATYVPTAAADYNKVGVKIGDTSIYKSSFTGSTVNKTEIYVYGIVGTVVFLNITNVNPDKTINNWYTQVLDVKFGSSFTMIWLIASNLTAHDPTYSGSPYTINETKSMTIGGATRTVNHFNLSTWPYDVYWDKPTGIMVKLNVWFFGWMNYTLISTTAKAPAAPSIFNLTTILLIGNVVELIIIIMLLIRRGGKRRR